MLRCLLWCALAALAVIPTAATAGGPSAGVTQGSDGVAWVEGTVRYAAQPAGAGIRIGGYRGVR